MRTLTGLGSSYIAAIIAPGSDHASAAAVRTWGKARRQRGGHLRMGSAEPGCKPTRKWTGLTGHLARALANTCTRVEAH